MVLGNKLLLVLGLGFARDEFGFLEDKVQAMQHGGHATEGITNTEMRVHPTDHRLHRVMELPAQMNLEFPQLAVIQQGLAADGTHAQQLIQAAVLVTFKIGADRIRVQQQGRANLPGRPTLGQQDHRINAVGFTHIQRPTMRAA